MTRTDVPEIELYWMTELKIAALAWLVFGAVGAAILLALRWMLQ